MGMGSRNPHSQRPSLYSLTPPQPDPKNICALETQGNGKEPRGEAGREGGGLRMMSRIMCAASTGSTSATAVCCGGSLPAPAPTPAPGSFRPIPQTTDPTFPRSARGNNGSPAPPDRTGGGRGGAEEMGRHQHDTQNQPRREMVANVHGLPHWGRGAGGGGGMMPGFEITGMILTSCETQSVRLQPAPNVALSSPLISGYQCFMVGAGGVAPLLAYPRPRSSEGLSATADVRHVTQRQGLPEHQVAPISGALHVQGMTCEVRLAVRLVGGVARPFMRNREASHNGMGFGRKLSTFNM